jgi:hypothetical protein
MLDLFGGSTSNDRVEMRLNVEESAERHMPFQSRRKDSDERVTASFLCDIHRALTERILQRPPSAEFDESSHRRGRSTAIGCLM